MNKEQAPTEHDSTISLQLSLELSRTLYDPLEPSRTI